jgi:hypothetical protein
MRRLKLVAKFKGKSRFQEYEAQRKLVAKFKGKSRFQGYEAQNQYEMILLSE